MKLELLQRYVPILTSFIFSCSEEEGGIVCPLVREVIADIAECMTRPFLVSRPSPEHYLPPKDNQLSFFPNLPLLVGHVNYAADRVGKTNEPDECRKFRGGHPCSYSWHFYYHGVCYVMSSPESPHHPFHIFRMTFEVPPRLIIYDNACKLHQYCLNREPLFFKHTQFAVDRFHWRGHVGCSVGYNLYNYDVPDIKAINSQVITSKVNWHICLQRTLGFI